MQHGSENRCTTSMGRTIEEMSLAKVFEEKLSVLRCGHYDNKGNLIKNGDLD